MTNPGGGQIATPAPHLVPHHARRLKRLSFVVPVCLAACVSAFPTPINEQTPIAEDQGQGTIAADLTLSVTPPAETPDGARLVVLLVDEVSGLPFNTQELLLEMQPDGRWQTRLPLPLNTIVHYRYALRGTATGDEVTADGNSLRYRTIWIRSTIAVEDQVAAWTGGSYAGSTGRIVGFVVDATTGEPLAEIVVSASGVSAFTDGRGAFRLEGLLPGLHTLTAISPDGSTVPFQQGAVVAPESATSAQLGLQAAHAVQVTFEVEIPATTAPGIPLRFAGNMRQFGDRVGDLPGTSGGAVGRMPTLVQVDATHFIMIAELFAGSDLRYKYTLGNGLWNAERDPQGFLVTRQLIVPESDLAVRDVVASWSTPDRGSVAFAVTVPEATPGNDQITLQFMPSEGLEPLPMWRTGGTTWSYIVYGPLDFPGPIEYRYCRVGDCSGSFETDSAGDPVETRQMTPSPERLNLNDEVAAWAWWTQYTSPINIVAPEIVARPGFETGVEFQPAFDPNWNGLMGQALAEVAQGGANAVTLTPGWVLGQASHKPLMALDPTRAPFKDEVLADMIEAERLGLEVFLRPTLTAPDGDVAGWWMASPRDPTWWATWFEGYRAFVLSYARIAAEGGADKLILGGPEAAPAFPGGRMTDGSPSNAPLDAEAPWREIISEVRGIFPGRVAFEVELGDTLQPIPPMIDTVDEIHVLWHAPLNPPGSASIEDMRAAAGRQMDETILSDPRLTGKPIVLSIEYLSVQGGSSGCIRKEDLRCYPASAFEMGAIVDPSLAVDLEGQALAINAVVIEAYARPAITGILSRGYNPVLALRDKSASVRGKPAQDVLWFWFPRLTGGVAP